VGPFQKEVDGIVENWELPAFEEHGVKYKSQKSSPKKTRKEFKNNMLRNAKFPGKRGTIQEQEKGHE